MTITAYTTAPVAYDYGWTVLDSVDWGVASNGDTIRRLTLVDDRYLVDYQLGRYASGMYLATEDESVADTLATDRYHSAPCPECDGAGQVSVQISGSAGPGLGYMDVDRDCSECGGTGRELL